MRRGETELRRCQVTLWHVLLIRRHELCRPIHGVLLTPHPRSARTDDHRLRRLRFLPGPLSAKYSSNEEWFIVIDFVITIDAVGTATRGQYEHRTRLFYI